MARRHAEAFFVHFVTAEAVSLWRGQYSRERRALAPTAVRSARSWKPYAAWRQV